MHPSGSLGGIFSCAVGPSPLTIVVKARRSFSTSRHALGLHGLHSRRAFLFYMPSDSLDEMSMPPNIYYRTNEQGLLEAIDIISGKVVAIQHAVKPYNPEDEEQYSKVTTPTGETVYIARELVVGAKRLSFDVDRAYSPLFGDLIIQKVVEGATFKAACRELQVQYSVANKWKNENLEFRKRLEDAYRDRAEVHHDEVFEIAEESRDAKARIEARKWSAEKFHPERFGQKTKISGDQNAPLQFIIQTGVPERSPSVEAEKDVTPRGPAIAGVETEAVAQPASQEVGVE